GRNLRRTKKARDCDAKRGCRPRSAAIAVRHRVELAVTKANPAAAVVPVVIATPPIRLTAHHRADAEADQPADRRAASATGNAADRGAGRAAQQRAACGASRVGLADGDEQ